MSEIGWALALAGFAGLVRYLQQFRATPRPAWVWGDAAISVLTGVFVGLCTLWLIGKKLEERDYVYFAVAIAAYGGPVTLDFFVELCKQALSRAAQKPPNDGPKG